MIKSVEAAVPQAALNHLRAAQQLLDAFPTLSVVSARLSLVIHEVEEHAADLLLQSERSTPSHD